MSILTNNQTETDSCLEILKKIRDPEIGLNIVDLGLIRQLDFDEADKAVYVSMTLTTRFCPLGGSITDNVEHALQAHYPGHQVQVHLVFDPPWTAEAISSAGKKFLDGKAE